MADDTEDQPVTPVAPPSQVPVPRGTGYTYSTPGPANWAQPQTVTGPAGPVQIPQNAQNFTSIVGPPPEDQETAAFRKMFNSLPMDQAIKAYQAAKQFQGQRVLQTKLAGYSAAGLAPEQALSRAMTDAAAVGLFSTPKEVMELNKNLTAGAAAAERARQQMDALKFREQSQMDRTKYIQEQENARNRAAIEGRKKELSEPDKMELTSAYKTLEESKKKLEDMPDNAQAKKNAQDAVDTIRKIRGLPPLPPAMPEEEERTLAPAIGSAVASALGGPQAVAPTIARAGKKLGGTSKARVLIKDKSGKKFTVPDVQLPEALKQGYQKVEEKAE